MDGFGELTLVSLGSNAPGGQAAAAALVLKGSQRIAQNLGNPPVRVSSLYATPAFPAGIGPDFVNAAIALRTDLSPQAILDILHGIEAEADRIRDVRWGQRTLDLDLLAVGQQVLPDATSQSRWRELPPDDQRVATPDGLILPHPRIQDRAFVLVPLATVAPDWVHPMTGRSVVQMRDALPPAELESVVPLPPRTVA